MCRLGGALRKRGPVHASACEWVKEMCGYETMANVAEDKLIDGISFKMQPGASYAIERKMSWS